MSVFATSANGVEGVPETYSIPMHGIPLWTRNGAVSGWVPRYGSGSREGVCWPPVGGYVGIGVSDAQCDERQPCERRAICPSNINGDRVSRVEEGLEAGR